jgi:hypothetical protein
VLGHSDKAGVLRHDCFVFSNTKLFCFYFILLPSVPNMRSQLKYFYYWTSLFSARLKVFRSKELSPSSLSALFV